MLDFSKFIKINPYTKEAIIRLYEIGMISYETMVNLIWEGQEHGDWQ